MNVQQPNAKGTSPQLEPLNVVLNTNNKQLCLHVFQGGIDLRDQRRETVQFFKKKINETLGTPDAQ